MIHRITSTNRTEWLESRQGGIGSSEVATILGFNKWETPIQLWRRKLGLDPAKVQNEAMQLGHDLEPVVANVWERNTGKKYFRNTAVDYVVYNDLAPWRRVSPDREYYVKGRNGRGILECKTTGMKVTQKTIKQWFVQLQYQLGVCGYEYGSLAWLVNGRDFDTVEYAFSRSAFEQVVDVVDEFWFKNIKERIVPTAIRQVDIDILYPHHEEGKKVEASEDILTAVRDLKHLKEQKKELEQSIEGAELIIKLHMEDAERLISDGETLATYRSAKDSEKFDSKAFAEAYPDLYAQYLKPVKGSRRFLLR